jgi:hypothetical protein
MQRDPGSPVACWQSMEAPHQRGVGSQVLVMPLQ